MTAIKKIYMDFIRGWALARSLIELSGGCRE